MSDLLCFFRFYDPNAVLAAVRARYPGADGDAAEDAAVRALAIVGAIRLPARTVTLRPARGDARYARYALRYRDASHPATSSWCEVAFEDRGGIRHDLIHARGADGSSAVVPFLVDPGAHPFPLGSYTRTGSG